jgi:hypothetical protein
MIVQKRHYRFCLIDNPLPSDRISTIRIKYNKVNPLFEDKW